MHPDLEELIRLQALDLEWKQLRDQQDQVPRHLAQLAARSAAAQGASLAVEESLAREEKVRRSLEGDVRDQNQRSTRAKRQMDVVTTTAQATALEHEIAFAEGEVRRLEDAELASMERAETMEAQRTSARGEAADAEAVLERERLRSAELLERGSRRLEELKPLRSDLRSRIGESALSIYDRVAKAKGTGVAEGVDQRCSACQMLIRPQRWNDLRDRSDKETMMTCESCGRLLFWDPARDAPTKKPPAPDPRAAGGRSQP